MRDKIKNLFGKRTMTFTEISPNKAKGVVGSRRDILQVYHSFQCSGTK